MCMCVCEGGVYLRELNYKAAITLFQAEQLNSGTLMHLFVKPGKHEKTCKA